MVLQFYKNEKLGKIKRLKSFQLYGQCELTSHYDDERLRCQELIDVANGRFHKNERFPDIDLACCFLNSGYF